MRSQPGIFPKDGFKHLKSRSISHRQTMIRFYQQRSSVDSRHFMCLFAALSRRCCLICREPQHCLSVPDWVLFDNAVQAAMQRRVTVSPDTCSACGTLIAGSHACLLRGQIVCPRCHSPATAPETPEHRVQPGGFSSAAPSAAPARPPLKVNPAELRSRANRYRAQSQSAPGLARMPRLNRASSKMGSGPIPFLSTRRGVFFTLEQNPSKKPLPPRCTADISASRSRRIP